MYSVYAVDGKFVALWWQWAVNSCCTSVGNDLRWRQQTMGAERLITGTLKDTHLSTYCQQHLPSCWSEASWPRGRHSLNLFISSTCGIYSV